MRAVASPASDSDHFHAGFGFNTKSMVTRLPGAHSASHSAHVPPEFLQTLLPRDRP